MATDKIITRRGRPKKLDQTTIDKILHAIQTSNTLNRDELINKLDIQNVHIQTVRNHLINAGYCKSLGCQQLWLTADAKNARLEFATSHKSWRAEWRSVLFVACASFDLSPKRQPRAQISKNELLCVQCQLDKDEGYKDGIHLWAAVGFNLKNPLLFPTRDNPTCAAATDRHLTKRINDKKQHIIIENGPSGASTAWIQQKLISQLETTNIEIIPCPRSWSDFNVSQDVLFYLKKQVQKSRFDNLDYLKAGLLQEWDCISVRKINRLINSMPSRMNQIIMRSGMAI